MPQKTKRVTHTKAAHTHLQLLHKRRIYWFATLVIGLLIIQLLAGFHYVTGKRPAVLGYATNVSIGALLDATNQSRASQGLGPLVLHSKLSSGAQAKANHMIANNYWSHNAPDGTQPWYFFTNAGYKYTKAGENLAYGFDTSGQIVDAWMNSPGHRVNVLGSYVDVGFGIANGANFQGAENTVIVAFYAVQNLPPPAPAPKPTPAPTPAPAPAPKPEAPAPAPPTPAPVTQTTPQQETPKTEPPKNEEQKTTVPSPSPVQEPKKVTNLETALSGNASWAVYASLAFIGLTSVGFASTHVQLVRRGWCISEHFILIHPALDTAILAAAAAVTLSSAAGFIK